MFEGLWNLEKSWKTEEGKVGGLWKVGTDLKWRLCEWLKDDSWYKEYDDFCETFNIIDGVWASISWMLDGKIGMLIKRSIIKSGFSFVKDDLIEFREGDFYARYSLNDKSTNFDKGIYRSVAGKEVFIKPDFNFWNHHNKVPFPDEKYPWEWSKDNIQKYLVFSKNLLNKLEELEKRIKHLHPMKYHFS